MKDENHRFRILVKKYRTYFKLTQEDLAPLLGIAQSDYSSIEIGKKIIDFNLADKIASVYGLRHYKMADPDQSIPEFENLPNLTQDAISKRKEIGVQNRDYEKGLSKKLDKVIFSTSILYTPVTAQDILEAFSEENRKYFDISTINRYLRITPRNEKIIKTGEKKDGLTLYILKSHATEEMKKKHEELESKKGQRNSKNVNKQ